MKKKEGAGAVVSLYKGVIDGAPLADNVIPWHVDQMKLKKTRRGIEMTAAVRQQTAPEQRRFEAALELLLNEIVRQEIASRKAGYDGGEELKR